MSARPAEPQLHFSLPTDDLSGEFSDLFLQTLNGQANFAALVSPADGADGTRAETADGMDYMPLIKDKYRIEEAGFERQTCIYRDTFDWRLYKQAWVLAEEDGRIALVNLAGETVLQAAPVTAPPRFGADLPTEALRTAVAPISGIRALLPMAIVEQSARRYRILNKDDKTVVRLELRRLDVAAAAEFGAAAAVAASAGAESCKLTVVLQPVRGYKGALRAVTKFLEKRGFTALPPEPVYAWALAQLGRRPGAYAVKPTFPLTPQMRSDEAVKVILRALQTVMRANEAGIMADFDTEFLHDYRTAVRRTRSALSQIKDVFPPETARRYRKAFGKVGDMTNELRDLDVYLLARRRYRKLLPKRARKDIDPLFDFLATQRTGALQRVVDGLTSPDYRQLMDEWEAFLQEPVPEAPAAANAEKAVADVAQEQLLIYYRNMIKEGNRILEENDDKLIHALRIDGKKLRYLLEFFADILPEKESKALIKQLKRLQDCLGDYNDLAVQQSYLLEVADKLPLENGVTRRTLIATGRLIEKLALQQREVRANLIEIFAEFASPANQRLFTRLLAADKARVAKGQDES